MGLDDDSLLSICAILAVRNGRYYLPYILSYLSDQDIDVVIIDHESTDGSRDLYEQYANYPIIDVIAIPFNGVFSLTKQLEVKREVIQRLNHRWIIHHDADEVMEGRSGENLRTIITNADNHGYNVINFDEFVFIPEPEANYCEVDFTACMKRYYFFQPELNRLNRAFLRSAGLTNLQGAGHRVTGNSVRLFPVNQTLRHYIVLSQQHAYVKYLTRHYLLEEVNRGWHKNRVDLTREKLRLPQNSPNFHLYDGEANLSRDLPVWEHYWDWSSD